MEWKPELILGSGCCSYNNQMREKIQKYAIPKLKFTLHNLKKQRDLL